APANDNAVPLALVRRPRCATQHQNLLRNLAGLPVSVEDPPPTPPSRSSLFDDAGVGSAARTTSGLSISYPKMSPSPLPSISGSSGYGFVAQGLPAGIFGYCGPGVTPVTTGFLSSAAYRPWFSSSAEASA